MAVGQSTSGGSPGNPGIVDLEVGSYAVRPDFPLNAIEVEIVNPVGDGVRCLFSWAQALDFALKIATATTRLRGGAGTVP